MPSEKHYHAALRVTTGDERFSINGDPAVLQHAIAMELEWTEINTGNRAYAAALEVFSIRNLESWGLSVREIQDARRWLEENLRRE